jgi:hypothetical protein
MKKRDRKFAAAFHVGPKAKVKWDIAVREAEAAMKRTRYCLRKYYIYSSLPYTMYNVTVTRATMFQ